MVGSTRQPHDPSELGELERALLTLIWQFGSMTAEAARLELGRDLKESTVRTVLGRLEEKGYLRHEMEGRRFVYLPAESQSNVASRAVRRILDWFCSGSVEALIVGMVDSAILDKAELKRLADSIEQERPKGGNDELVN
jgi:predicted transcriptional regulator